MQWTPSKRLVGSLFKLARIVGGAFGGFYVLFDLVPSSQHEMRAGVSSLLAARRNQSREPGPRIIFRLDDVEQGVRENQIFAVLSMFERNGVPVEVGIVPRANGKPSYALPGLKTYLAKGISISACTASCTVPTSSTVGNPDYQKTRLRPACGKQAGRFWSIGVRPLTFLVPYDVFDENGYRAVREAGFEILSSQWQTNHHRGTSPVDFGSRPDDDGLIRLPAVDDAVSWDSERESWDLLFSIRTSLEELGVAVISLHPAAFGKSNGEVDAAKLASLDKLIEEAGQLGQIATFRNWCYAASSTGLDEVCVSVVCQ